MNDILNNINGPLFRNQRMLLLKIAALAHREQPYEPLPGDANLLEGLVSLTDSLADLAHDQYGIDCLLDEGNEVADETARDDTCALCPTVFPGVSDETAGDDTCALCPTPFPGVSDAVIDAGWIPSYSISEEECDGPVCPNCVAQFIVTDPEDGEWELNLKGEYVSVWDGGVEVRSICTVNPRTRKVEIEHTTNVDGLKVLEREYVVLNGKQYPAASEEERVQYSADEQAGMFFHE